MESQPRKIVIVGATSAIAHECARLWVAGGPKELLLVVRDEARARVLASDLQVRSPGTSVAVHRMDFLDAAAIRALADGLESRDWLPDLVFIAHGTLPDQTHCQEDLADCRDALLVNGVSPVLFAEALAAVLERAGRGTLAIVGSVAGDRGRRSNYLYGAAKAQVARHAQGMQHRLAGSAVRIVLVKPGPTETPMTAHLRSRGVRLAPVRQVAAVIVDGIRRGRPVVHAPRRWALIMLIVIHLPRWIFNRMDI